MDQYGSVRNIKEDWDEVVNAIKQHGTVVFAWSHNSFVSYIFMVSFSFWKMGILPWGGNPVGRAYVGVQRHGCDHLTTDGYLQKYDLDNLGLDDQAGEPFCKMWNYICTELRN